MVAKQETHVSDLKKAKVKELAELMKKKTVMVVSIKGLPSAQFQDIKKKLRGKARVQVVKKSLIDFALDHSGIKELHELVPYVDDSTAMLFSDADAFEISGILANEKSPAKAKAGQIAPSDIEVKAGPTELIPGPDISALSAVGLAPKVENGKIAIMQDKVIVKEGDEITEAHASIMAKLDIIPFEVGVEPVAAFDGEEKKVYADIKIDKDGFLEILLNDYGRGIAFAVDLGIVNDTTINLILSKAVTHESAINELVDGSNSESLDGSQSETEDGSQPWAVDGSATPEGEVSGTDSTDDADSEGKVESEPEASKEVVEEKKEEAPVEEGKEEETPEVNTEGEK